MSCHHCGGYGIAIQEWTDADPDFAICVCPASLWFRARAGEQAYGWQVWCSVHQVEPSRVFKLEELYTPQELATAGLVMPKQDMSREAALLAAGRRRK